MPRYIVSRLISTIIVVFGVVVVAFLVLYLIPGDPAYIIAGPWATPEAVENIRIELYLDQPLPIQFILYLTSLLRGDFGSSVISHRPVLLELIPRYLNTLQLALASLTIASIIGVIIGVTTALRHRSVYDTVTMGSTILTISTPSFILGLFLLYIFSLYLRWFPSFGRSSPLSIVLPAITNAAWSLANIARLTRTSVLETLNKEFVRTMKAMGLPDRIVNYKYALKNAIIPVLVIIGIQFGYSLAGAVFTEAVFSWPGIGTTIISAIFSRDFPMLRGGILLVSISFVVVNLITDIIISRIDPRIRYD